MSNENTETPEIVSADTDDLEQFDALFHGRTEEEPSESGAEEKDQESEPSREAEETSEEEVPEVEEEEASEDEPTETDETEDTLDEEESDETDEEEGETEEPQKPKKKTAQERIAELTAIRREQERRADAAEQKAEQLEKLLLEKLGKTEEDGPAKTTEKEAVDTAPTPEDRNEDGSEKYPLGEFDPQFIRDLTRHTITQETEAAQKQSREQEAQRKAQEEAETRQEKWTESLVDAETKYEDFRDSVADLEDTFAGIDPDYGQYLADTIMDSEYGPDVLYYLSQNKDEAQNIVDSGARKATLALGRLEAQIASVNAKPADKPTKKVTKAKAPPTKTTRGNGGKFAIAGDTDNLEDFEKQFFKT